jgi:hypothetical protein
LVEWLQSLLSEEEGAAITVKNYKQFMPEQTHVFANQKILLNAYHPKWIAKKIKQLLLIFPDIKITDISLEHIQWKAQRQQA